MACNVTTENGAAQVGYSAVTVQSAKTVQGRLKRLNLDLTGNLSPAGGSFTIQYDVSQMTAGSIVTTDLLKGYSLVNKDATPGQIQVT